jgi:hypothetical protein
VSRSAVGLLYGIAMAAGKVLTAFVYQTPPTIAFWPIGHICGHCSGVVVSIPGPSLQTSSLAFLRVCFRRQKSRSKLEWARLIATVRGPAALF